MEREALHNSPGLADFGEYREAIDTMVKLLEVEFVEELADEELAYVYREELWAMRNNFSDSQWQDAVQVAERRFTKGSSTETQSA